MLSTTKNPRLFYMKLGSVEKVFAQMNNRSTFVLIPVSSNR